jgi:acylphosphatase
LTSRHKPNSPSSRNPATRVRNDKKPLNTSLSYHNLASKKIFRYHMADWVAASSAAWGSPKRFEYAIRKMIAKRIIFIGRVQGVGFRFTARRIASRHRLTGFVRNLHNGTVEMLAQGTSDDIDNCITDIKQAFLGYITQIKIEETALDSKHSDFTITF